MKFLFVDMNEFSAFIRSPRLSIVTLRHFNVTRHADVFLNIIEPISSAVLYMILCALWSCLVSMHIYDLRGPKPGCCCSLHIVYLFVIGYQVGVSSASVCLCPVGVCLCPVLVSRPFAMFVVGPCPGCSHVGSLITSRG